jgi:hypothetical protein
VHLDASRLVENKEKVCLGCSRNCGVEYTISTVLNLTIVAVAGKRTRAKNKNKYVSDRLGASEVI